MNSKEKIPIRLEFEEYLRTNFADKERVKASNWAFQFEYYEYVCDWKDMGWLESEDILVVACGFRRLDPETIHDVPVSIIAKALVRLYSAGVEPYQDPQPYKRKADVLSNFITLEKTKALVRKLSTSKSGQAQLKMIVCSAKSETLRQVAIDSLKEDIRGV